MRKNRPSCADQSGKGGSKEGGERKKGCTLFRIFPKGKGRTDFQGSTPSRRKVRWNCGKEGKKKKGTRNPAPPKKRALALKKGKFNLSGEKLDKKGKNSSGKIGS